MNNLIPTFSVVIPSYNSEKNIRMVLESIRSQNFNQDLIEILIVDGGSTDKTIEISKEYNCKIVNNPFKLPEYAVAIGINESRGIYCAIQASDEVLTNKASFSIRENIFKEHVEVNSLILTGLSNPEGFSKWGEYYNCIGDPFSSFIYGPCFTYLEKFRKSYAFVDYEGYIICKLNKSDIMPLIDGVQTFRRDKFFNLLGKKEMDTNDVPNIASLLITDSLSFAVLKNNLVLHYSASSFKQIIKKIHFRVINNVYKEKGAGFINREISMPQKYKHRKFLFIPYSFLLFPALYDSLKFAFKTKNFYFISHFIFSFYTAFDICFNILLKKFGVYKKMKKYS